MLFCDIKMQNVSTSGIFSRTFIVVVMHICGINSSTIRPLKPFKLFIKMGDVMRVLFAYS